MDRCSCMHFWVILFCTLWNFPARLCCLRKLAVILGLFYLKFIIWQQWLENKTNPVYTLVSKWMTSTSMFMKNLSAARKLFLEWLDCFYVCFWLSLLNSSSYLFFLYHSPSYQDCWFWDRISDSIAKTLSLHSTANKSLVTSVFIMSSGYIILMTLISLDFSIAYSNRFAYLFP